MAAKRKDPQGRVLKKGEGWREAGKYFYRYKDASGSRKTIYAATLKELRDKEKEIENNLDKEIPSKPTIKLKELIRSYLNTKASLRRKTIETYEERFNAIKNDKIMDTPICDLKSVDIKKWVIKKNETKASSTVTKYMNTLISPALDMAVEDELILANPIRFKLKDVLKKDQKENRALSEDESERLIEYVSESGRYKKYLPILILALNTGLRKGELCALTIKDFDFDKHILTVDKQLQIYSDNTLGIVPPKSKSGVRKVPLNEKAEVAAKQLIEESRQYDNVQLDGYSGFIMRSRDGNILSGNSLYKRYASVIAGYDKKYGTSLRSETTFHSLRHTYATNLVNKGLNPKTVQYIMGHSKITTTLDIYAHVSENAALDDYFKTGLV